MIIKNFDQLSTTTLRKNCLQIAEAGFEALKTKKIIASQISLDKNDVLTIQNKTFNLNTYKRIICVGFGKVALEAVSAISELLGDKINCGFVIDLKQGDIKNITCKIGTHPEPTVVNVEATQELVKMLETSEAEDLVICVVGGGGSALLCSPYESSCANQNLIINQLMKLGADIQEINTVRKHISAVKGGNLAKICYPATVISLIFSDVPGNDLSMVASGPTVKDNTTIHDAELIFKKYNLFKEAGITTYPVTETPKDEKFFEKVNNFLVVSGTTAINACRKEAEKLGYKVSVFSEQYQGEARTLGPEIAKVSLESETCLLGCGESTVKVMGNGIGGRNQELILSALPHLKHGQIIASFASDGHDNSDSAGAIADYESLQKAKKLNLDPEKFLNNNDSFTFFQKMGDKINTGNTETNISDFFVCLQE